MGWNPNEGYYQKHVKGEGFSNKITSEQEQFNKIGIDETSKGIEIVSTQIARENGTLTQEETKEELTDYGVEHISDYEEFLEQDDELDR